MTKPLSKMSRSELVDACIKEQQRSAALAAHVELLTRVAEKLSTVAPEYLDHLAADAHLVLRDAPATSLARLKAKAKAEAFENLANYAGHWTQADMLAIASDYRRQAEGGDQ